MRGFLSHKSYELLSRSGRGDFNVFSPGSKLLSCRKLHFPSFARFIPGNENDGRLWAWQSGERQSREEDKKRSRVPALQGLTDRSAQTGIN